MYIQYDCLPSVEASIRYRNLCTILTGNQPRFFSVCIFAEFSTQIPNPGTNGPEVKSLHSGHVLKFCIFAIFNTSKTVKHINNSSLSARVYSQ